MTPEIAEQIAAIGRVIDPARTGAIYAPLHDTPPFTGVTVTRDIKYGPAERNLLDVIVASDVGTTSGADVRAWRRLHRRQQGDARLAVL
jgi:triacylglycerol lipase